MVLPGFYLVPSSEAYSSATSFYVVICIFMSVVGQFYFSSLENWPSVGGILHIPAVHSPLITQAICSWVPPKRSMWVRLLCWADYVGGLVGCQALPPMHVAGCCLAGPGHSMACCGNFGDPGVSTGSLLGRVRVLKTLGLLPTHWQVKPGPYVNAGLLAGRAGSWSLATGQGLLLFSCSVMSNSL